MKPLLLFPAILLLSTVAVNLIKTADSPVIEDVDYQWDIVASDHKIPIYPGSRIIKESSSDGAYNLVLETKDQPEKVASYYKKEMQSLGWPDGTVMSVKNSAAIMLNDNGKQFALKAVFNNGVTHVNIVMLGNYNHTTMPVATVHSNDLPIALPDNSNENIYEREIQANVSVNNNEREIQANVSVNNNVSRLIDLRFTSPESGEIWEKGRTYTIRWDKTGGTENVKILLKDLMNQSSIWVSMGEDHVIQNTGYYSFKVPTNLPESAFELQIMTPDESYMNTSQKFYIGLTDNDLSVKAINFGKRSERILWTIEYFIVSEIWLKNKGTSSLNEVSVNWKIVREPSGVVERQGDITFKNLTPDTWYSEHIKVIYYADQISDEHFLGGRLEPGEMFVLILNADIDNLLGEMELTRNDNTYRTEILYDTNY